MTDERAKIFKQVAATAKKIGELIAGAMEGTGYGFTLIIFEKDRQAGALTYMSNAERESMVAAMKELIKMEADREATMQ